MKNYLKALKSYASTYIKDVKTETSSAFGNYLLDGSGNFLMPGMGLVAGIAGGILGFGFGLASFSLVGILGGTIGGAVGLFSLGAAYIAGEQMFLAHPKAKEAFKDSLKTQPEPSLTKVPQQEQTQKSVPAQGSATSDFKNGGKGVTPAKQNTAQKKPAPKAPQSK